ncbi:MAG: hypothetical protein L6Q69_18245 [Zoogloea sp.]|nr:hypothetical protein [Zoogloea sp.]
MPPTETAEAKAKREAEEKAKKDSEAKAKRETEEKAKKDAEAKAKGEAEEKAKKDPVEKQKHDAAPKGKKDPAKLAWAKYRIAKGKEGDGRNVRAACLTEDTHIRTPSGVKKANKGDYLVMRQNGERFVITEGEFKACLTPIKG